MPVANYALPIPAPHVDYKNYDREKVYADEQAHKAALKAELLARGFTGKHTGRIYRENVADGYALYMVVDPVRGSKAKFGLIHLPYGDGYRSNMVHYLPKSKIISIIDSNDAFDALFKK